MKRGSVTKSKSKLVAVWIPTGMSEALDLVVEQEDTDRSKFIRRAISTKFTELGIKPKREEIH